MVGPILIRDKSSFQGLSLRESIWTTHHFMENVTPTLVMELVGDLAKPTADHRPPAEKVAELARKFGGSGGTVSMNYRTLCLASLAGEDIPNTGAIVPDNFTPVRGPDGSVGGFIDVSQANMTIMRLAANASTSADQEFARRYRAYTKGVGLDRLNRFLLLRRVALARARSLPEAMQIVSALVADAARCRVWVDWLLSEMPCPSRGRELIYQRIDGERSLFDVAPYAAHCVLSTLLLAVATRNTLISVRDTNVIDLQYLFYLPFCHVFVSDDRLHRALAPFLVRPDQDFVPQADFKRAMREVTEFWESQLPAGRRLLDAALGMRPPPLRRNIIWDLYEKHCIPWNPTFGNRATDVTDAERAGAIEIVRAMIAARA